MNIEHEQISGGVEERQEGRWGVEGDWVQSGVGVGGL